MTDQAPVKRGRGRPRKNPLPAPDAAEASPKRGRGRPRKNPPADAASEPVKRPRGRPRKDAAPSPAPAEKRPRKAAQALKRSDIIIRWIEGDAEGFSGLRVPEGKLVGQPVRLLEFQKRFIRDVYDNPHGTRRGILSVGRKNGKTALIAMLLIVHVAGPMAEPNSGLFSSAQSREQAAIVFTLACKMIRQSPELREYVVIRETAKEILCPQLGTKYRALSADATTAYGLSPALIIHDEIGQVKGPRSELYDSLETAVAAHESPLTLIISTQAATDADLLSVLIDDALAGHDPRTICHLHTADEEIDAFEVDAIRQANPALGVFQNEREVLAMAADAKRMPSREAEYRNLVLNQRVAAESPFVSAAVWTANEGAGVGGPVWFGGLDLSETSDLTALVLVAPDAEAWAVESTFWLPAEGIEERARLDRVEYDVWARQGHVQLCPGRSVDYSHVAEYLARLLRERNVAKIAFDRYNMRHLRPWLINAGMSEAFIDDHFVEFGQGYQSMSPALRSLEALLLNAKLRTGAHPVLRMCAANAIVKMDEAGSRKLDKKRSRGRIDGMVALAMAAEVASSHIVSDDSLRFRAEWWKTWNTPPAAGNTCIVVCGPHDKRPTPETTIWVLKLMPDRGYYVVDGLRERLDVTARTQAVFDFHRRYQPLKVGYEARGLETDLAHINDMQSQQNYRFRVEPLAGTLSTGERIARLQPLFSAGRVIFPERLTRGITDLVDTFRRNEYDSYPLGQHADMLDTLSRVLDLNVEFPALSTWKAPPVFPSDW